MFALDRNTWNNLTVYKRMSSGSLKNVYTNHIYLIYVKTGFGIE